MRDMKLWAFLLTQGFPSVSAERIAHEKAVPMKHCREIREVWSVPVSAIPQLACVKPD